jgi:putative ABC transport system permease protein
VYVTSEFAFADSDGAERVPVALVSASLLELLPVRPALGRLLRDDDVPLGPSSAIVLGHDFWVRRFGADPHVIGRSVQIESRSAEIVAYWRAGSISRIGTPPYGSPCRSTPPPLP